MREKGVQPPAPEGQQPHADSRWLRRPEVRSARVVLEPVAGPLVTVRAELARTPAERAKGLMYRRSLAADAGMLFVFDAPGRHVFWMANTPLSLDLVFIASNGRVVGLVERAEPMSGRSYAVGAPSLYVLEVPAGFAARHGVQTGALVRIEPPERPDQKGKP